MLAKALTLLTGEIVMGLADDIYEALKGVKDANQAKAKLRGVLKARLHEEVHNAVVRALR